MSKLDFRSLVESLLTEQKLAFRDGDTFEAVLLKVAKELQLSSPEDSVTQLADYGRLLATRIGNPFSAVGKQILLDNRTGWPIIDIVTFMVKNFYQVTEDARFKLDKQFNLKVTPDVIESDKDNIISTINDWSNIANNNYMPRYNETLKRLNSDVDIRAQKIESYINDTPLGAIEKYLAYTGLASVGDARKVMYYPLDAARIEAKEGLQSIVRLSQTLLEFYRTNAIAKYTDTQEVSTTREEGLSETINKTVGKADSANSFFQKDYVEFLNGRSKVIVEAEPNRTAVDNYIKGGLNPATNEQPSPTGYPSTAIKTINDFKDGESIYPGSASVWEAYINAIDLKKRHDIMKTIGAVADAVTGGAVDIGNAIAAF